MLKQGGRGERGTQGWGGEIPVCPLPLSISQFCVEFAEFLCVSVSDSIFEEFESSM